MLRNLATTKKIKNAFLSVNCTVNKIKYKLTPRQYAGPHRSFKLTPKSSYKGGQAAKLPQLISSYRLLRKTFGLIRSEKKAFILLTITYLIFSWLLNGLPNSSQYASVRQLLDEVLGAEVQSLTGAATLLFSAAAGLLSPTKSELAQFITGLTAGIFSLCCIWIARQHLAGHETSARQALYNAPAPLIVISMLLGIMVVQTFPASIGALLFSFTFGFQGAEVTGLAGALMSISAVLLIVLSVYLVVPTYMAMVIATLPNTYPVAALKSANLLTYQRRGQIILRFVGIAFFIVLLWLLMLAPVIAIELFVPAPDWFPFMQIALDAATAVSVPIVTIFTYQLYRELL